MFYNKRTGLDTVLVVNAHNKGRLDEHCCLKLPERDRKGKKTKKYIHSCVKDGHNTAWEDANISEKDRNVFREWKTSKKLSKAWPSAQPSRNPLKMAPM
jgi:hypothetical protein